MIDGRVSAARALWLLEQLGEGSALRAAVMGGPEFRPWTTATTIAAYSLNALNGANWQRGGGRGGKPKPIEPPQPKAKTARQANGPRGSGVKRRIAQQVAMRRAQAAATASTPPTQD